MAEVLAYRSGTDLVALRSGDDRVAACTFRGEQDRRSLYRLGAEVMLRVRVGGRDDVLKAIYFARGCSRDVYRGSVSGPVSDVLGEFVVKIGSDLERQTQTHQERH
jgi:hypothetical protein